MNKVLLIGTVVQFMDQEDASVKIIEHSALYIEDDKIKAIGGEAALLSQVSSDTIIHRYPDQLILPGFIDGHLHYPQSRILACHSPQLLNWLCDYTFPEESRFHDIDFATEIADFFIDELLRHGTTNTMAFATSHPNSVDALFSVAQERGYPMNTGKVMMDRDAPEALLDTPQAAYDDSKALIKKWHRNTNDRFRYVITPRFALTSTPAQLEMAQALVQEHPDLYFQTHLSENHAEIERALSLFPKAKSYTDIYAHYDLLTERSIFAHAIHLNSQERAQLSEARAILCHCPTSNLFLGSGLFDLNHALNSGDRYQIAIGSDIGGGTSFSMLETLKASYYIAQLHSRMNGNDFNLDPVSSFYMATTGNARALGLDQETGAIKAGLYGDLVVLNPKATPILSLRNQLSDSIKDQLFALMILGDDRAISATYVNGNRLYYNPNH